MPKFSNGATAPDLIELLDLISEQAHSAKAMIELMRKASDCEDLSDAELSAGLDAIDANLHTITDNCSLTDINHSSPVAPTQIAPQYADLYAATFVEFVEASTGNIVSDAYGGELKTAVYLWLDFVKQHSQAMRTPRRDAANNDNGGAA